MHGIGDDDGVEDEIQETEEDEYKEEEYDDLVRTNFVQVSVMKSDVSHFVYSFCCIGYRGIY